MLLSRKNQLLLEFSFWNEPVPRAGPNIYELRSYQLRVSLIVFYFFLSTMLLQNVQSMFIQYRWNTDLILEMRFLSKLVSELVSKWGVQNEGRLQQDTSICRAETPVFI